MDFLIDGKQKLKRHFSENQAGGIYVLQNTLYILLPRCYTSGTSLRVQVGGRTSNGEHKQLLWTPLSETIVFGRSIAAGVGCAHGNDLACHHGRGEGKGCEDPRFALIRDLVRDAHFHSNVEALDRISVDGNGWPAWEGRPWPGGEASVQLATDGDIDALFN